MRLNNLSPIFIHTITQTIILLFAITSIILLLQIHMQVGLTKFGTTMSFENGFNHV